MKQLILTLFIKSLLASCCAAQEIPGNENPTPATRPAPARSVSKYAVTFTATDTCVLKIDGMDYGEIRGGASKTVKLPLGVYRLFFESLETGETIKNRSFRLAQDSVAGGFYTYPVTFKKKN